MDKILIHNIRNFCIIAHIDHGKSTLADRFLELTHTISEREKKDQILDSMDLERERGITIKMQPVTMRYGQYIFNLIDTPGHVDFSYEVSRALAAVEGAILLVDASCGIQAQTLANLYLALEQDLTIIPVINKIDLKVADIDGTKAEIASLLGCGLNDIIAISAKTGQNVEKVLQAVVERIPQPATDHDHRALIFDSYYDKHFGVVCDIRVFGGIFKIGDEISFYQTGALSDIKEAGIYTPKQRKVETLSAGQIGYLITGIREPSQCQVGDTVTNVKRIDIKPLHGYKQVKPMVFANIYLKDQSKYLELKTALEELKLNDSSLYFEPAASGALGKGFKLGILGLLHLDIIKERILREYSLDVILTVPQVEYRVKFKIVIQDSKLKEGKSQYYTITSPQEFPENTGQITEIQEPRVKLEIVTPQKYIGGIMQLAMNKRGEYVNTEYIANRAILYFKLPLAELLTDFYDKLKSASSGYASLNYEFGDWKEVNLIKLDFLIGGEEEESLSMLVPRHQIYARACRVLEILKSEIPPHLFEIRLQAKIGGKIIASERIKALKKNVTAKLYGGDVTRKRKLLEKQKKGKKKMMALGQVDIPNSAYLAVLRR